MTLELPEAVQAVLDQWATGEEPGKYTEDYLDLLVDALSPLVKPVLMGKEGRPPNHPLLPLLIWAEVSRYQIRHKLRGHSTAMSKLSGARLANGRVYGKRDLERIYSRVKGVLAEMREGVWLEHHVRGAIVSADMNNADRKPYMSRLNANVRQRGKTYRKKLNSELAAMSEVQRKQWAEQVALDALYHQLVFAELGVPKEKQLDRVLKLVAAFREIDLDSMDRASRIEWIDSVFAEVGFKRT